jgi:hypothetical protein
METFEFLDRLVRASATMNYYGVMQIKENNIMAVNSLAWFRGIEAGAYHVWANECRGVFVPQHTHMIFGFLVFPGV